MGNKKAKWYIVTRTVEETFVVEATSKKDAEHAAAWSGDPSKVSVIKEKVSLYKGE